MRLLWIEDDPEIKIIDSNGDEILIKDNDKLLWREGDREIIILAPEANGKNAQDSILYQIAHITKPDSFDELSKCINTCVNDFDFVIIDIDLSKWETLDPLFKNYCDTIKSIEEIWNTENERPYESKALEEQTGLREYEKLNETTFSREAGFIAYQLLLEKGFPRKNLFFYTANGGKNSTYSRFLERFYFARLKTPDKCFNKTESRIYDITNWIMGTDDSRKKASTYLTFRRAVIEMCSEVIKSPPRSQRLFKENDATTNSSDFMNYIDRIRYLLPLQVDGNNEQEIFKSFLRELSSPFDRINIEELKYEYYQTTAKNIRNWLAHNNVKGNIELTDIIFFFKIIMCAVSVELLDNITPIKCIGRIKEHNDLVKYDDGDEIVKGIYRSIGPRYYLYGLYLKNKLYPKKGKLRGVSCLDFYKGFLEYRFPHKLDDLKNIIADKKRKDNLCELNEFEIDLLNVSIKKYKNHINLCKINK